MNHHRKDPSASITRHPAYRRALQSLNEAIEQNTEHPNVEKIRLMRIAMFSDIEDLEQSDTVALPQK